MKPWKTVSRSPVLHRGKYLTVEDHTIELPDGRIIDDWPWLAMPDYINVIAETTEGKFLCFRQTKYAIGETVSLAPIGGYVEPGEPPDKAARRELREETGYESDEWFPLGTFVADGNRGGGNASLFLARGARRVSTPANDDLEQQDLVLLSSDELLDSLLRGEFKVLSWAANVALVLLRREHPHG